VAEEIIFGPSQVTTGASNDIERATDLARNMVTKWGLSEKLGPLAYTKDEGEVFLGHSVTQHKQVSDETFRAIDEEVRSIIDRSYGRAKSIIDSNLDKLHMMAEALIKYETIESEQIDDIMAGITPRAPKHWSEEDRRGPPKPDVKTATPEPGKADGAIGGPASQH
jgi:cell division protease FtsH